MFSSKSLRSKKLDKRGTQTTKKHRFESFNKRISKLSIDPIRRRRTKIEDVDPTNSTPFFRVSLDRWKDLNLSENFTSFAEGVNNVCNTLPQLLHHQDRIIEELLLRIGKKDPLSLEPLLDLLSNFAHDLGVKFENYYERAVTLVVSIAADLTDPEAIEWSFICLTWLFKYLSRLLIPNLRPTFRMMAPFLGKAPQKSYIVRFAAEVISFLLRKAAIIYPRDEEPLKSVLEAIQEDLATTGASGMHSPHYELYKQGLSTLFLFSMKGVDRKLHSGSSSVYQCMLEIVLLGGDHNTTAFAEVLNGVTVALIHHSDANGFQPILDTIIESLKVPPQGHNGHTLSVCARLLLIIGATRQGSRITNWNPVLDRTLEILACSVNSNPSTISEIYKAVAVALQYSPLDSVMPRFRTAVKILEKDELEDYFLPFCNYFCDLGRDRFQSLLLPHFYQFLVTKWRGHEIQLCLSAPKLAVAQSPKPMICPETWQDAIADCFEGALARDDLILPCFGYLNLLDHLIFSASTKATIDTHLYQMVQSTLGSTTKNEIRSLFGVGAALRAYVRSADMHGKQLLALWPQLCATICRYRDILPYLKSLLEVVKSLPDDELGEGVHQLVDVVIENLHSASHPLREISLQLLQALYEKLYQKPADVLSTALEVEICPLDHSSSRAISMYIRKLSSLYPANSTHEWLSKAIVHFCFGLLSYKLASAKKDAIATLKQICESKTGEALVSDLCFTWLASCKGEGSSAIREGISREQGQELTGFQCSNLIKVEKLIDDGTRNITGADEILQQKFDTFHEKHYQQPVNTPQLALQVLGAAPFVAEKRSRRLVPMFLSWARDEQVEPTDVALDDMALSQDPEDEEIEAQVWGLRDRKAMLDLFSCFLNPSVLYRSSEVFDALQALLTNGDVEIQKAALKSIFTWKIQEVLPYQEHLMNLLDEKLFRDELSTFLQVDERDSVIETGHREALMPLLLRLLYGRIVARTGAKSGSSGQPAKRRAVMRALSRLDDEYLRMFVEISLGPLRSVELLEPIDTATAQENSISRGSHLNESAVSGEVLSARKQVGLVNMVKDMLSVLGGRLGCCSLPIINAVLYCLIRSNRILQTQVHDLNGNESEAQQTSLHRTIRQSGLQCLILLFKSSTYYQIEPFKELVFNEVLRPRLENLAIETAQSVSGILQLIATRALSDETVSMLDRSDDKEIPLLAAVKCLGVPSAKDEVKLYVINDILKKVVGLTGTQTFGRPTDWIENGTNARKVLRPAMGSILESMGVLLKGNPSKELLASAIEFVSMLGPLVESSSEVHNLLEISTFLLEQPSQRVSPKSKGDLLKIIKHFLPLVGAALSESMLDHIYRSATSLFGYFKDRSNRLILSEVMTVLAAKDEDLRNVAELCVSLNSFSVKRLDEPDFDQRLQAFASINEEDFRVFTPKQWRPILYNMLYFVKDNEELAIRTNAGFSLRRFVDMNPVDPEDINSGSFELVKTVLLPALRSGASEPSELVRSEYLTVMAHLIQSNPMWDEVSNMRTLLVEADEEASFFSNILHIQQHRRLRALRRLAAESKSIKLNSANVAHYFIPLIEHFVFNKAEDESAHNLSAETVNTIGALTSSLEWPQFRAMFRRYSSYLQSKPGLEKAVIRLLGVAIDSLLGAGQYNRTTVGTTRNVDVEMLDESAATSAPSTLARTLPEQGKLADDLLSNLLPSLTKYIHEKDESTVSLRVPIAVSVVKSLKLLPSDNFRERLPAVLTDVCHILRSRAQESRDLTRRTLTEISTLIGPEYFGFVLKELRGALARGYQLHVLSFTVHSILVATSDIFKPGDLNYCLNQIVAVIMDDIFGATGQEKDAEEYISKMKEVKSSKSYDSMELVARTATVEHLVHLVRPLQALLEEKMDLRLVKKVDELLRRIGLGLMRNACIEDQRVLIFSHEIIREVYEVGGVSMGKTKKEDYRTKRYLIQAGAKRAGNRGSTSSHSHKLVRFALDIARALLAKFEKLRTPSNLAGFIPIIGDAILQSNEEIQTSSLRLLTTIIKVPLKSIDDNAGVYVAECVKIIKSSTSTHVELAQAALKLVSAILRERRTVEIREADLAYLLRRLTPDLEEPEKQGIAFTFLKAIMARKIVITEVYEIIDVAAVIMVTNQSETARDMARGAYFQFIMEYPQSKERFSKQSSFLAKNLDYKFPEGRQSVMEAINMLFNKVGEDLVQDVVGSFFVPLVLVIVNDESSQCRELAGALLRSCFSRADGPRTQSFFNLLQAWLDQSDEVLLVRAAVQVYGMFLDVEDSDAEKQISGLQTRLGQILKSNLKDPAAADWEVLYYSLQTLTKIGTLFPAIAFASTASKVWQSVLQCLTFPHAWVKLSSAKLLGIYFADFARTNAQKEETTLPLFGSRGLHLSEQEIINITRASLALLRVTAVGEELAAQSVRNLVFLGKIAAQTSIIWPASHSQMKSTTAIPEELGEEDDFGESEDEEDLNINPEESSSVNEPTHPPQKTLLTHILHASSYTLRQPLPSTPPLIQHNSHLTLLTTLLTHLPLPHLTPPLPTILLSLHNLTDPSIPLPSLITTSSYTSTALRESFTALRAKATETMDLIAKRVGVTSYAALMAGVGERVRERREERRGKRRGMGAVEELEWKEKKRRRRGERNEVRRRERGRGAKGLRLG